jgi:hypothetical protein
LYDDSTISGALSPQLADDSTMSGALSPQMADDSPVSGALSPQLAEDSTMSGALSPQLHDDSTVSGALLSTAQEMVVFFLEESLRALGQPVSIPLQLGALLSRTYPAFPSMAAAILKLFTDKMIGGALYHIRFVGRLVGMLGSLVAKIVRILTTAPLRSNAPVQRLR